MKNSTIRKNKLNSLIPKSVEQGSQTWCPQAPGRPQGHVRRPQAYSKNTNSMINVFTLTNVNTKIRPSFCTYEIQYA